MMLEDVQARAAQIMGLDGADLGILITRGRLMTNNFRLNARAKAWIKGMRTQFQGRPLGGLHQQPLPVLQPGAFKIL